MVLLNDSMVIKVIKLMYQVLDTNLFSKSVLMNTIYLHNGQLNGPLLHIGLANELQNMA